MCIGDDDGGGSSDNGGNGNVDATIAIGHALRALMTRMCAALACASQIQQSSRSRRVRMCLRTIRVDASIKTTIVFCCFRSTPLTCKLSLDEMLLARARARVSQGDGGGGGGGSGGGWRLKVSARASPLRAELAAS